MRQIVQPFRDSKAIWRNVGVPSKVSTVVGTIIALWGMIHVVVGYEVWPDELRAVAYRWKNYASVAILLLLTLVLIGRGSSRVCGIGALGKVPALVFWTFPVVGAVTMLFLGEVFVPVLAMYFLCTLYYFWLAPRLLAATDMLVVVRCIWWAIVAVITLGIAAGVFTGMFYWRGWSGRLTFGFHPNIYGQALGVWAVLSLVLAASGPSKRWFYAVCYCGAVVLLWFGVARSYLVFAVMCGVGLPCMTVRNRIALLVLLGTAVVVGGGFAIYDVELDRIDSFSSGRLRLYEDGLARDWDGQGAEKWLVGSRTFMSAGPLMSSDASAGGRFQRSNIDNAYLAVLMSHGIVGLVAFIAPFGVAGYFELKDVVQTRSKASAIAFLSMAGLATVSLTQATIPSLGNCFSIWLPLLLTKVNEVNTIHRAILTHKLSKGLSCEKGEGLCS